MLVRKVVRLARRFRVSALELPTATLFSSLVGSLHCVGMCSPFAMLAMGQSSGDRPALQRAVRLSAYHLGRLATYLLMGILVAAFTLTFQIAAGDFARSQWIGWGVGMILIVMGMVRLFESIGNATKPVTHSAWVLNWTRSIVSLRKRYASGPAWLSSFLWGFSSTFLPCGWLYVFVLASAAAPSPTMTVAMMVAFWVGTLPLLTAAAWSWSMVGPRWRFLIQPLAAICILAFGFYTLMHRSQIDLSSIATTPHKPSIQQIRDSMNAGLPCCVGGPSRGSLMPNTRSIAPSAVGTGSRAAAGAAPYGSVGYLGGNDAGNP